MSQQQVQVIQPQQEYRTTSGKKGGGDKWGKQLGGAVGAVAGGMAGMATGGAPGAVAGTMGGAVGGAHFGQMLGDMIEKPREGRQQALERRMAAGPQIKHSEQSERLKQSLMALRNAPPAVQADFKAPLIAAYIKSVGQDNPTDVGVG